MNSKSQDRLVVEINREFSELERNGRFATAVVATYLSHKRRLLLTNAGHPHPLLNRKTAGTWECLSAELTESENADNLPLGVDGNTKYQQFAVPIDPGDCLVLYTDALTEASDANGNLLGETGLLQIIREIPISVEFDQFGRSLLAAIAAQSNGTPLNDDATLIVIRFNATRRIPGVLERLTGYGAVIRDVAK